MKRLVEIHFWGTPISYCRTEPLINEMHSITTKVDMMNALKGYKDKNRIIVYSVPVKMPDIDIEYIDIYLDEKPYSKYIRKTLVELDE